MGETASNTQSMASFLSGLYDYAIRTTEPVADAPLFILDPRHAGAVLLAEMAEKQEALDYSGYFAPANPSVALPIDASRNPALPNKTLVTFDSRIFSQADVQRIVDVVTKRFVGDGLEVADPSALVRVSVAADYPNGVLPKGRYGLTIQDSVLQAIVSEASVRRGDFVRQASSMMASLADGDLGKLSPMELEKLQTALKGILGPGLVLRPSGVVSFVTPDEQMVVILPSDTPDGKTPAAESLIAQLGQFAAPANTPSTTPRQR